ncbi:hypothetical protein SNE40_018052 [Patella caerulea]|uniref:Uncharacterized protein n=1 Tax=Patella caerulea TaxID=87958 RepID=A0AAN8JBW8_PATCE
MKLVPVDEPSVTVMKPYEPVWERDPIRRIMEEVSTEMDTVLKSRMSDADKMQKYGQLFERFQTMQKKLETPQPPPPPPPSSQTPQTSPPPAPTLPPQPTQQPDISQSILESVPIKHRPKAKLLLKHIKEKTPLEWNDNYELVRDGQVIKGTNAYDIVNDLMRSRKTVSPAPGWSDVVSTLKKTHASREWVGNADRWKTPTRRPPVKGRNTAQPPPQAPHVPHVPQATQTSRTPLEVRWTRPRERKRKRLQTSRRATPRWIPFRDL